MINEKLPHDTLETNRHIIKYKSIDKPKQKMIQDIKSFASEKDIDMQTVEKMIAAKFGCSPKDKVNHFTRKQNFSIHFLLKMLAVLDLEMQFVKKKK